MTAEREMTLHEWVGKLPEIHLARREFVAMQALIATLEQKVTMLDSLEVKYIEEIQELHERLGHGEWK